MNSQRRSSLDIQASILRAVSNDELSMNKIVVYVNLNRKLAKKYVRELFGKGFLEVKNDSKFERYSTTEKGMEWLTRYKLVIRDLKSGSVVPDDGF
jgi:predicted transcriptional regulator